MKESPDLDYYQSLSVEALAIAPTNANHVMLWMEIEIAVTSICIFYTVEGEAEVHFSQASKELDEMAYQFWHAWRDAPGNVEWRGLVIDIVGGKFAAEVIYPEEFDPEDILSNRRQKAIEDHFGTGKVNYGPWPPPPRPRPRR